MVCLQQLRHSFKGCTLSPSLLFPKDILFFFFFAVPRGLQAKFYYIYPLRPTQKCPSLLHPEPLILKVKVKVHQSCPTLCDLMDYTVHGILQARLLEWVAVPFSRGSSQPTD